MRHRRTSSGGCYGNSGGSDDEDVPDGGGGCGLDSNDPEEVERNTGSHGRLQCLVIG